MSFSDTLKNHSTAITSIFATIATIGGATIYVQNNFASAQDLKEISKNQQIQTRIQSLQQSQMALFQLEYYDDRIRKLQEEKAIAETVNRRSQINQAMRSVNQIQEDISDTKQRRELVRRIIAEQPQPKAN